MNNFFILNRLFSENCFYSIAAHPQNNTYGCIVKRFVDNPQEKTNASIISEVYSFMSKNYRNEYFYQNTLLNKLLLGKHSVFTTTALSQIPIAKSKADFILINGKAVVYEIKTELDNFDRLNTQLGDYYKAFNHVCLVTSACHYHRALDLLKNTNVGIYVLTKTGTISSSLKKEPTQDDSQLRYSSIFKVLRKYEYESILLKYYGELPKVSQVAYYNKCFELFSEIPMSLAYSLFLKELKNRNRIKIENFDEVPYELKSLMYFSQPNLYEWNTIKSFLGRTYLGGTDNVFPVF